jgi:23S rRNA pseudouridine1911/1915/1917 synthase
LVNGAPCQAKTRPKGGESVLLEAIAKQSHHHWQAQNIPLSIVYEDEALMIVNKPAGMVVHPSAGHLNHTLLNALLHHVPTLQALPRAGILHRLDKDTSGLLVVAKSLIALKTLSQQLKKRTLLREYQTIVSGTLISGGTVRAPIGRHPLQRTQMTVLDTGKEAITHYRIAEKYRSHTRLNIRLETGRTHQIRVHMAYIHHPIVGDPAYNKRLLIAPDTSAALIQTLRSFKRQALHAYALGLIHPVSQKVMLWEAKPPEDMQALIKALRQEENKQT